MLEQDPRVGFISTSFQDFSQAYDRPLTRYLVNRWRLQKKDPNAAMSEPVKPIVFYLDRAIPEPIRSAARMGALWWNAAFEQAGFRNALRIEDLPEGADPMDIRYPTIQWTNRSGTGMVGGAEPCGPANRRDHSRRGAAGFAPHAHREQLLGVGDAVGSRQLPSLRWILSPRWIISIRKRSEEQIMLNRLALLTCHEMGHVLGLEHNFVASTYGRGSVMDYFAPRGSDSRRRNRRSFRRLHAGDVGVTTDLPSSGATARASRAARRSRSRRGWTRS